MPLKLWSTLSVQAPPGTAGGVSTNAVPQPDAPFDVQGEPKVALPPYWVVPYREPFPPTTKLPAGKAPSPSSPVKLWSTVSVQASPDAACVNWKTVPHPVTTV